MSAIPSLVLRFLERQPFMTISTCGSEKNMPHTSVVLYVMEATPRFYIATHRSSRKAQDLLKNPHVSGVHWAVNEMNVQWHGTAKEISGAEVDHWLELLAKKAMAMPDFWPPIFQMRGLDYIVFEITPTHMTAMKLDTATISTSVPPQVVILGE